MKYSFMQKGQKESDITIGATYENVLVLSKNRSTF